MRYVISTILILISISKATAEDVCATLHYGDDPTERSMQLIYEKRKALLSGIMCEHYHGSGERADIDECMRAFGYIRPISFVLEQNPNVDQAMSVDAANGVEMILTEDLDFKTEIGKKVCDKKPDVAARNQCVRCFVAPFLPECKKSSSLALNDSSDDELQKMELEHSIRIPFGQKNGHVTTRSIIYGSETTHSESIEGDIEISKCPKKSKADIESKRLLQK